MGVRNDRERERIRGREARLRIRNRDRKARDREKEREGSREEENGESGEDEVKGDDRGSVWQRREGSNEKRSPRREEIQLGFYITDPPLDVRPNTTCNFVMISDTRG